jgi:hypothetical protein
MGFDDQILAFIFSLFVVSCDRKLSSDHLFSKSEQGSVWTTSKFDLTPSTVAVKDFKTELDWLSLIARSLARLRWIDSSPSRLIWLVRSLSSFFKTSEVSYVPPANLKTAGTEHSGNGDPPSQLGRNDTRVYHSKVDKPLF